MTKAKWYTPQLSREIVSRLYFKAKAEQIPMTILANRIMEKALGTEQVVECRRDSEQVTHAHCPSWRTISRAGLNQQQSHHAEAGSNSWP